MHAARLDSSPRLQRVHELLSDGTEHSTRDIREGAHIEAVSATVAELRDGGAEIECRQAKTGSGQRVWLYRMTSPITPTNGSGSSKAEQGGAPTNLDPPCGFESRPEPPGREFRQRSLFA